MKQDTEELSIRNVYNILKEWGYMPNKIKALQLEIVAIERDYDTIKGVSDNQIKASTMTNETHDLSDSLILKETKIERLIEEISKIQFRLDVVDNAVDTLKQQDKDLINDLYKKRIDINRLPDIYNTTGTGTIYYRLRNIAKDLKPLLKAIS